MKEQILDKLAALEEERNIRILYACESGSRAWGFESQDSDYDVRFYYVHQPEWYLSISEKRDVIENVGKVLDFNGWELRKMLRLFYSSNTSIYEKLQSPIVYREVPNFRDELWQMVHEYYKPIAGIYSYLNLVRNFVRDELSGDQVKLKKYFYVLRSLLAAKWVMHFDTVPPIEFGMLRKLECDNNEWNSLVDDLLMLKSAGDESLKIPKNELLTRYIATEIESLSAYVTHLKGKPRASTTKLDEFFRKWII